MKGETTFENAKVGDKVWSFYGREWVTIKEFHPQNRYSIAFETKDGAKQGFTVGGETVIGGGQDIFWDEIKFEVPTRPKRRVRKKKIVWANIYEDESAIFHESEEDARGAAHDRAVATAVTFEAEYMVEE